MLVKKMLILFFLSSLVLGCAGSAKKINNLNIGMTKAEVIEVMGEPNYTSAANDIEILSYKLTSNSPYSDTYIVRIVNGKVDRFGKEGSLRSYY